MANAHRIGGTMPPAREARTQARKLWDAGAAADPGLLNEARVLHIEANLCCVDQRFSEARKLLSEAMRLDYPGMAAPLLYTEARVFEGMGDLRQAAAALERASSLVNAKKEPRLALSISFQLLVILCLEGRAEEAKEKLPDIRSAAERQHKELDLLRVVWLEGVVASGLGHYDEAESRLDQVRRDLAHRGIAYDCALVTLELAVVLLAANRGEEVCSLAGHLVWIFRSQEVHGNALAALRLFHEAAQNQKVTIDFTRRVLRFLYRAQHNPELRLEEEAGTDLDAPADRP
jgi:tetratricopeptide (TPR) repeat protein